jgi:electron transport complex protein RnfG
MKTQWFLVASALAGAAMLPMAAPAEELSSLKDALARAFPLPVKMMSEWVALAPDQVSRIKVGRERAHVPNVAEYHIAENDGRVAGFAIVRTVLGKHGPIQLLVATSPGLKVIRTEILSFNERRGRAVRKQSFLSQFEGKGPADAPARRKEVDGVTGATVSSRAVAQGVRDALDVLSVIVESDASPAL